MRSPAPSMAVSMSAGMSGCRARTRRSTSTPSIPGSMRSRTTTSGRISRATRTASRPSPLTWASQPTICRGKRRRSAIVASSSTMSTVTGLPSGCSRCGSEARTVALRSDIGSPRSAAAGCGHAERNPATTARGTADAPAGGMLSEAVGAAQRMHRRAPGSVPRALPVRLVRAGCTRRTARRPHGAPATRCAGVDLPRGGRVQAQWCASRRV